MSIHKDWMKEDNISSFSTTDEQKILYRLIDECMFSIMVSVDGGNKLKYPGQAMAWYLSRLPKEKADYIRNNFKAEHLETCYDTFRKACLQEIDEQDKVRKYPRRGITSKMKKA